MAQSFVPGELRPLSHDQIDRAIEEWRYYLAWEEVCRFALDLYGKRAYAIKCDYQSEYNDEGGTFCYVHAITVYDAHNQALPYDFSAPYWQNPASPFYPPRIPDGQTRTPLQAIDEFLRATLGEQQLSALSVDELQRQRCNAVEEHYMLDTYTCLERLRTFIGSGPDPVDFFELEKPPRLAFPELYSVLA